MQFSPKTILIYSEGDALGDALRGAKLIQATMLNFPDSKITWAYSGDCPYTSSLEGLFPNMDIIKLPYVSRYKIDLSPMKGKVFDLVIDKQRSANKTIPLRLMLNYKKYICGTCRWLFSSHKPKNRKKPESVLEQEMQLLEAITGKIVVAPRNFIKIDDKYKVLVDKLFLDRKNMVGLVPGAGKRIKCWPHYIKLAKKLEENGYQVIIFLGPDESEWYDKYKQELSSAIFPLQETHGLTNEYNKVLFTIEVGKRLDIAITNDCGTSHMLAESNIPLIVLFGKAGSLKYKLDCESYHLSANDFIENSVKIEDIPVDAVYKKAVSLLG